MVDVTVRGAGIFGLSIAWVCAERGARVQVIDPFGPGAGSSGGVVGALAPHVPENWNSKKAFQLESLLRAESFWSAVEATAGTSPGYLRSGRLQPIADERALELAHGRAESARHLWADQARWDVVSVETAGTWAPPSPTGWFIKDTLSALLHPRQAITALVQALARRGVPIHKEAEDKGAILWATGVAGLQALNAEHHRTVGGGVKGQAAVFDYNAAGAPQLFVDGLHIIPHADGTVAVGSTSEREYAAADTTDTQLDALIYKARAYLPLLRDAQVVARWAGVRPRARSRAPMLGPWPGRPGHYIANGGFKIGFGMAPGVAEVMADLLLDGHDRRTEGFEVEASF